MPITPEEDAELLEVFNEWEKQTQDSNAAMAREVQREDMTWEDLSDAR